MYLLSAIFFATIEIRYFSLYWTEQSPRKGITRTHIILQIITLLRPLAAHNWAGNNLLEEFNLPNESSNLITTLAFFILIISVFINSRNFFKSIFLNRH